MTTENEKQQHAEKIIDHEYSARDFMDYLDFLINSPESPLIGTDADVRDVESCTARLVDPGGLTGCEAAEIAPHLSRLSVHIVRAVLRSCRTTIPEILPEDTGTWMGMQIVQMLRFYEEASPSFIPKMVLMTDVEFRRTAPDVWAATSENVRASMFSQVCEGAVQVVIQTLLGYLSDTLDAERSPDVLH